VIQDEGQSFVRLDDEGLNVSRDIGLAQIPKDAEARKAHYNQMIECLSFTQAIQEGLPRDFNSMLKYSIASLGEIFTQTVNFALERLQLSKTSGRIVSNFSEYFISLFPLD
jgi:hypothetical protein